MDRECRVCVGQVFKDAKPPHREWRVTETREEFCRLERVDKPNVVRYPDATALRDTNRYLRETPAGGGNGDHLAGRRRVSA